MRLRKEYLYRKSLEGKEKAAYERKRLVRQALQGTIMFQASHYIAEGLSSACDDGSEAMHTDDDLSAAVSLLCMLLYQRASPSRPS